MVGIVKSRSPDYKDLDLDFIRNPGNSDIMKLVGPDSIKESIKRLVQYNFYEKPFQPAIGSNVHKLLFENFNNITTNLLKQAIEETIINFEPRVKLLAVIVSPSDDYNTYVIGIKYMIVNRIEPETFTFFLERIR